MIIPQFPRITLTGGLDRIDRALEAQSAKLKPYRYDGPTGRLGKWDIGTFNISHDSLQRLRFVRDGGRGMAAGTYTRMIRTEEDGSKTIVMSDTDAEMIDFLRDMRDVEGDVLVGGLGMCLAIKAMALTGKVKSITVVELDPEIIHFFNNYALRLALTCGPKPLPIVIVKGDILKWVPPEGAKYDWAWFDIWDTISDSNLPEMRELKFRYKRYMKGPKRQRCWAEHECKLMDKGVPAGHWY